MVGREPWKVLDEFLKEAVAGNIERLPKYKNTEVLSARGEANYGIPWRRRVSPRMPFENLG